MELLCRKDGGKQIVKTCLFDEETSDNGRPDSIVPHQMPSESSCLKWDEKERRYVMEGQVDDAFKLIGMILDNCRAYQITDGPSLSD